MAETVYTPDPWTVDRADQYGSYRVHEAAREQNKWVDERYEISDEEGERRNAVAELHDEGNRRLIQEAPIMLKAYEQVEGGFLDALHTLNDAGLACPASLGLAMEKLRQVVTNARREG